MKRAKLITSRSIKQGQFSGSFPGKEESYEIVEHEAGDGVLRDDDDDDDEDGDDDDEDDDDDGRQIG